MAEIQSLSNSMESLKAQVESTVSNRDQTLYTFTSYQKLVAHFSQWLPESYVATAIENEKLVFVVRREESLEETRLQFLKKCETLLEQISADNKNNRPQDWGYGIQVSM